jgi:hypothetical protein
LCIKLYDLYGTIAALRFPFRLSVFSLAIIVTDH